MSTKSKSSENLKQKSLVSFFGKQPNNPSGSSAKPPRKSSSSEVHKRDASESGSSPQTPASHRLNSGRSVPDTFSSPASTLKDTPPTSDAIDVDMLSDSEEPSSKLRVSKGKGKRKIVLDESDSDVLASARSTTSRGSSLPADSSPVSRLGRDAKRARMSGPLLDEEEEEEDDRSVQSFNQRLTRFKKSPNKRGRASSRATTDDEDYVAPSDSESEAKRSAASSRASSSSRRSLASETEDEEEERQPTKKSAKPLKRSNMGASAQQNPSVSFLTAAERREQAKKDEKKAAENPYAFLLDVKDKDGKRPGDPKYDPRTLFIPPKVWKEFTPFEKQFWEIKQNHYDTVLFFQKGKFFELYEDDARIGHREFDLKLTERVKMCMVGVPEISFNFWAAKFLGKGYKVGRVDQAETALGAEMRMASDKKSGKSKPAEKDKIVRRELHKVYTNGTLVDGEMITDDEAGHCISIREIELEGGSTNVFGVCVLDCSTSQFDLSVFQDDICRTKLETLMRQIRPKELLFTKGNLSVSTTRLLKLILPAACGWTGLREVEGLNYEATLQELKNRYPSDGEMMDDADAILPSSVPEPIREIADSKCAVEALGAMIWYLQQLNIDKEIMTMKNFNIYDPMKKGEGLVLDGQTLAHIEILLNNEGTEEGSLLKLLSRCITPFGKRLFRVWLCMPLCNISDINSRLDAVEDLINHPTFENAFTGIAKGLPDLERIVSRIHAKNCKVKDFLSVLSAFEKLSKGLGSLADASESFKSKTILGLLRRAPDLSPNIRNLELMYERPSKDNKDFGELIPREGKDEEYDEVMEEIRGLETSLNKELKRLEKSLGCSLSWWHSAVGSKEIYLVETSASQKQVPKDWTKNSGTKAKTRWIIPSLQKDIRSLKEARERRNSAIKLFKYRLFAEFDADRAVWLGTVRVFAELDCLFSLARSSLAIGEPSCRPMFTKGESAWVEFKNLRHPNIASLKDFIPNNVNLGGKKGNIALLTGPNMAGKSTVMRMTAIGIIMAQLGMFVPAEEARLCPVDSILTRMGAYDNMFSNASTFKVELDECCKILREATPKSLVILDELGRGTSTFDGMAIAGAVLHQLATFTLPLAFFATHYGLLTDDFGYHPNIRNMHMSTAVDDTRREIVFLYKLVEGVATSSFGTHVANLAGVPLDVVDRAQLISKTFATQFQEKQQAKQQKHAGTKLSLVARADFVYLVKLAIGNAQLPENPVLQKHVLKMMRRVVATYS
ncbi:DNA mismatch repair protein Msh6 [Marasmius fiardii PR-910]|nr:DNA mismatch repair protein Msh6 [Marasmius fiardii PR-910]